MLRSHPSVAMTSQDRVLSSFLPLQFLVVGHHQTLLWQRVVPRLLIGGAEHTEHRIPGGEQAGSDEKHRPPVGQGGLQENGKCTF